MIIAAISVIIQGVELGDLVEGLPPMYCAISDCAYNPTENMVPVYGGQQALQKRNDNFNFYASHSHNRERMVADIATYGYTRPGGRM